MKKRLRLVTAVAALICLGALSVAGQSSTDAASQNGSSQQQENKPSAGTPAQAPPGQTAAQQSAPEQGASGKGKVEGTSSDRLFYTLPNFLTLQSKGRLPPLSTKDKFKVVALGTFDPVQYPWWGLLSALNQAQNNEKGFGQGWLGYAKRYGTTAGDSTIENFMVGAVLPSALHQDPRFYYSSKGGAVRRAGYAVSRIFVTRGDSGKNQFNFSEILGSASAAAISTYSYHPKSTYISTPTNPHLFVPSDRTLSNTASVWETQLSLDTITLVVKEFWPDVQRKISKKHRAATQ